MSHKNTLKLIAGKIFETAKNMSAPFINNALNYIAPVDNFPNPYTKAVENNVQKDNWGSFGTFLAKTAAKTAYNLLTAPENQTNSALPPTEGTVTKFAPAVLTEESKVIPIPNSSRSRRIVRRKAPVRRGRVTTKSRKTVNEMVSPKKKQKKYVYRVNI
jgi:hypothetical protein